MNEEQEYQFHSLGHARAVRDNLARMAIENKDTYEDRVEKWCRGEGNYAQEIDQCMITLVNNFDGNGIPGYWLYLKRLKASIQYIQEKEAEQAGNFVGIPTPEPDENDLYRKAIKECLPEHRELMIRVWSPTPWMLNVLDNGIEEEIRRWCYTYYGRESSPIHEQEGVWKRGSVTIKGQTWYGFKTKEMLEKFQAKFAAQVLEETEPNKTIYSPTKAGEFEHDEMSEYDRKEQTEAFQALLIVLAAIAIFGLFGVFLWIATR